VGLRPFAIAGAAGATVAAVVADLLLARLPDEWLRRRLPAVTAGIAALLWTGQLVAFAVTDAIRWPPSLWLGAVVLSAAAAAGLAALSSWDPARS
jgi:MFS family permease